MKRKLAVLLLTAMSVCVISACGSEKTEENQTQTAETEAEAETEIVLLKDYDAESYVTLNEYHGIPITLTKPTVSEEDVDSYIATRLSSLGGDENFAVMDRAVEEGDTVNINYVGTLDGVAFDGGTDDSEAGTNLEIGSHSFIDGFEDGLIGVMPGETVDLNLTFPENYQSTDLAGKETVFTVTVNGIAPKMEDLTDEMAALLDEETTTVEEYRQSVLTMLTEEAQTEFDNYYNSYVEDAVVQKLLEECAYTELPAELVEKYKDKIISSTEQSAAMYQMDLETYIVAAYGMDYASFETMANEWAEQSAQEALTYQAIANKENLNVDDATLETELQNYAQGYGYTSVEEMNESMGVDISEDYREYLMFCNVLDYLVENAQVTVE